MAEPTAIRHLATIDSTNSECLRLANSGRQQPIWVLADQQSSGRGRLSRPWLGDKGNLYASGLYFFDQPPARLAELGFAAALAVLDTVAPLIPNARLRLKWPNDVLLLNGKLAGVLPESISVNVDNKNGLVIGIGINLSHAPAVTGRETACVKHALDDKENLITPIKLLPNLITNFEKWVGIWQVSGFNPLRQAWLANCYGLGSPLETSTGISGVFEDMSKNGALMLRKSNGQVIEVSAGEVFFADIKGQT